MLPPPPVNFPPKQKFLDETLNRYYVGILTGMSELYKSMMCMAAWGHHAENVAGIGITLYCTMSSLRGRS